MTFGIKKVWTRHYLTHDKDFALVELSFSEDTPDDIKEGNRFATIEYGKKEVSLLDVCGGKNLSEAIKNRENLEGLLNLINRYGGSDKAFRNQEFIDKVKAMCAR